MSEVAVSYKEKFTVKKKRNYHLTSNVSSNKITPIQKLSRRKNLKVIISNEEFIEIVNKEFDFSVATKSKKKEKGYIDNVKEHKYSKKPFSKVVVAMFLSQPFFKESTTLAKEQISNDMLSDAKSLAFGAILANLVASIFSIPFWIMGMLLLFLALCEFLFSISKRFRLEGVDYTPISKLIILLGAIGLFTVASVVQVCLVYFVSAGQGVPISELREQIPAIAEVIFQYLNIQTLVVFFLVFYYVNSIRKMWIKGAGIEAKKMNFLFLRK